MSSNVKLHRRNTLFASSDNRTRPLELWPVAILNRDDAKMALDDPAEFALKVAVLRDRRTVAKFATGIHSPYSPDANADYKSTWPRRTIWDPTLKMWILMDVIWNEISLIPGRDKATPHIIDVTMDTNLYQILTKRFGSRRWKRQPRSRLLYTVEYQNRLYLSDRILPQPGLGKDLTTSAPIIKPKPRPRNKPQPPRPKRVTENSRIPELTSADAMIDELVNEFRRKEQVSDLDNLRF